MRRVRSSSTPSPLSTSRPAGCATRRRSISSRSWSRTRSADLLPGTGFNGATIARSQLLRPYPQFGNVPHVRRRRHERVQLGAGQDREALHAAAIRVLAAYTWSQVHRARVQAESERQRATRTGCRSSTCRTASRSAASGSCRSATAGAGPAAPPAQPTRSSAGGACRRSGSSRADGRSTYDRNVYFNGDLGALKSDYSGDSNQPVFDISGFYFHDAAVQTNGVDDPAKQRADSRIRLANNVRYFPSRIPTASAARA